MLTHTDTEIDLDTEHPIVTAIHDHRGECFGVTPSGLVVRVSLVYIRSTDSVVVMWNVGTADRESITVTLDEAVRWTNVYLSRRRARLAASRIGRALLARFGPEQCPVDPTGQAVTS
jgi:hypothetical protein